MGQNSNKRLVRSFEKIQKMRLGSRDRDWEDKKFVTRLISLEHKGRRMVLKLLMGHKLRTADDFYRASYLFHHGDTSKQYLIAVSLALIGEKLGDNWCKNLVAVSLDRLLLSIGLSQHFGTQISFKNGKHKLMPVNAKTTDAERKLYYVDILAKTYQDVEEMNEKLKSSG